MLKSIGYTGMDEFIEAVIPSNILEKKNISIGEQRTEEEVLKELRKIATKNKKEPEYKYILRFCLSGFKKLILLIIFP